MRLPLPDVQNNQISQKKTLLLPGMMATMIVKEIFLDDSFHCFEVMKIILKNEGNSFCKLISSTVGNVWHTSFLNLNKLYKSLKLLPHKHFGERQLEWKVINPLTTAGVHCCCLKTVAFFNLMLVYVEFSLLV